MAAIINTTVVADLKTKATEGEVLSFKIKGRFDATAAGVESFRASLEKLGLGELVTVVERGAETTTDKNDLTAVREWAAANGHTVGTRGRLSSEILDAFAAAQV